MKSENKLVSFCIITYKQRDLVEHAVRGALAQDYSPMEIIISDDASKDGTFERVKEIIADYNGPHKIVLNENSHNLGIRENINKVVYELSKGEYILFAGGDDVSAKDRTSSYVNIFERFPDVMSISCISKQIDKEGNIILDDEIWDEKFALYSLTDYVNLPYFYLNSGDSRAIRRKVADSFLPLTNTRDEDIFTFLRSLYLGQVCYLHKPLVNRRITGNNASSSYSSKELIRTMEKQVLSDLEFAYQKKYISELEYKKMRVKLSYLMKHFRLYTVAPTASASALFYRIMRKIGFTAFFPSIYKKYINY